MPALAEFMQSQAIPERDPDLPEEGKSPEGEPRTEPENPEPDPDRIEKTEEDLDKVGN